MTTTIDNFSIFANKYAPMDLPQNTKSFDELINLATYNISAFGFDNQKFDLVLGGSSNVVLEGSNAVKVFTSSEGMKYYKTTVSGGQRTDEQYLSVSHASNMASFDTAYNVDFNFDNTFSMNSLSVDTSSPLFDAISSTKKLIEIRSNLHVKGTFEQDGAMIAHNTVTVEGNLMANNNFRCSKAIFGSNLNVFRQRCSNGVEMVGYGFQVNNKNQLELIKTITFENVADPVSKKVAVFGINEITPADTTDTSYLVFNELQGLGISCDGSNSSNGSNSPNYVSGDFLSIYGGAMQGDIDMAGFTLSNAVIINATDINATNVTAQVYETVGSDYAEYLEKANPKEKFEKNQVVGIDSEGRITSKYDDSIRFMVISDDAGVIGGRNNKDIPSEIVAFCGRVRTQLPINACISGDYLVPCRSKDGSIEITSVRPGEMDFMKFISSIGQVINISENRVPLIIIK